MNRLLGCLALVTTYSWAATPLFRAGFEIPGKTWTSLRGSAATDSVVLREGKKSLRVEPGIASDACVQFAPVPLHIGKRYELTGWARTEDLQVRDLDRSPIAIGAALSMASMPFDVHSAALGGTTRLDPPLPPASSPAAPKIGSCSLPAMAAPFTESRGSQASPSTKSRRNDAGRSASRHHLRPRLSLSGRRLDLSSHRRRTLRARLSAWPPDGSRNSRIPRTLRRRSRAKRRASPEYPPTGNALFLRGFDREILEEMSGIADGASDAGARWSGRAHRPDRYRGRQHHRRTGRIRQRHANDPHRTRRPQLR